MIFCERAKIPHSGNKKPQIFSQFFLFFITLWCYADLHFFSHFSHQNLICKFSPSPLYYILSSAPLCGLPSAAMWRALKGAGSGKTEKKFCQGRALKRGQALKEMISEKGAGSDKTEKILAGAGSDKTERSSVRWAEPVRHPEK